MFELCTSPLASRGYQTAYGLICQIAIKSKDSAYVQVFGLHRLSASLAEPLRCSERFIAPFSVGTILRH